MTKASNLGKGGSNFDSSGVLGVAGGGTGATTQAAAAANVLPTQTGNNGKYLTTDGTNTSWGTVTSNPGTVTSVGGTGTVNGISLSGTVTSSGNLTLGGALTGVSLTTQVSGTLPVANGGTGTTTPSIVAGTNISVTGTWPNQTINNTSSASGTVTSVATGNGLSGGTITSTGTLVIACPSWNSVGSYALVYCSNGSSGLNSGSNYSAGTGNLQMQAATLGQSGGGTMDALNNLNTLSGTWKWMCASWTNVQTYGLACRVS